MYIYCRRKDKEIRELEETCTELEADTKKGQSIVAKLLLVVCELLHSVNGYSIPKTYRITEAMMEVANS